jgi:arginine/lysine/ornithine decarboxylase
MPQDSIPLYESCKDFLAGQAAPLYCPGHKGGRTLPEEFRLSIAELDLNNLAETDTLHCPSGPIRDAEGLLAEAYGVKDSFMLVGGSTSGNIASILSVCQPGDEILVQRNAHKSTIAGVVLSGARPVWLTPQKDAEIGIYHGIDAEQLDRAFREHPRAVGAVVLNPTYHGTVADIRSLRAVCDQHEKLLVVDEAHGPHFRFHEDLPTAAEEAGADLVVQSTHKILSGLSQAAVLHRVTDKIPVGTIRKNLQLIQTTSPSFPVMISIDLARWQMMRDGIPILSGMLEIATWARLRLSAAPGVRVLGRELLCGERSGFYDLDQTKIVIDVRGLGLSGLEFQRLLNQRGVKPELAGPTYVLAILTVGSHWRDVEHLVKAVEEIASEHSRKPDASRRDARFSDIEFDQPQQAMAPRESFFGAQESVALENAIDRVSAEIVTPYPPGIPVLMPGERISASTVANLLRLREAGFPISASTPTLSHILVVSN